MERASERSIGRMAGGRFLFYTASMIASMQELRGGREGRREARRGLTDLPYPCN